MTLPPLTSLQNPKVKELVRLRSARARRQTGLTRVDGGRELRRALESGLLPETVYLCPDRLQGEDARAALRAAEEAGAPVQEISAPVYEKLAYGDRDEGLCATLRWSPSPLLDLSPGPRPLLLVLEALEKPGNLGAILRTADAAGVDAVLLCDPGLDPTNPNAIRASMGTVFTVPLHRAPAEEAKAWLDDHGIAAVAATPEASVDYTEADLGGALALVLGAEHAGLSPVWREGEILRVRLPMRGRADSLNVSAAAAILLYEALRQRGQATGPTEK